MLVVSGVITLLVASGAGYGWWQSREKPKTTVGSVNTAGDSTTPSGLSLVQQNGATGVVIHSTTPSSATINTSQTADSTQTNQADNQGVTVTLDPTEFGMYDSYKTAQSSLFAEIVVGTGTEATPGRKLSVNYRGWLTNGSIFDQNVDSTKPFVFTLGAGSVIPGWEQGVNGMKVGGERLIIIPPAAGYGNIPQGPIPASSVLVFYVKLLAVQ